MIGVGVPWILGTAVFAALATCVLHFLSVRRPPTLLLPTMRFLPERPVRAVSRSARPSDLWLLLLRVVALLLIGAALGGLYWRASGVKHGRIVVIQRDSDDNIVGERSAMAEALRGAFATDTATRIVVIDSVAHLLTAVESKTFQPETLSKVAVGDVRSTPTFSAAVLAATRAAGVLVREERNVDAVDLVIVAPFVHAWIDVSTAAVRATWPGAIRFANPDAVVDSIDGRVSYQRRLAFIGANASDAVHSAFVARGWLTSGGNTLSPAVQATPNSAASNVVVLNASAPKASALNSATTSPNHSGVAVSIEWPASGVPEGWTATKVTTIGALVARGEVLVFPFARTAEIPESILAHGRALAWWSDGAVAAVEIPTATSCTRHVGIPVPAASDVLQGQGARALLFALSGPCGGERSSWMLSADDLRVLGGTGLAAPASAFKSVSVARTPWAPWLLLLAMALLFVEWFLRDREDRLEDVLVSRGDAARKVA